MLFVALTGTRYAPLAEHALDGVRFGRIADVRARRVRVHVVDRLGATPASSERRAIARAAPSPSSGGPPIV